MEYDLDLASAAESITRRHAKRVLIQLPDGLKPYAEDITLTLEKDTGADILIWGGSCFGACDLPLGIEGVKIDLVIQWGHSKW